MIRSQKNTPTVADMVRHQPQGVTAPAEDPELRDKLSKLTGREREISLHIAEGKTNSEIAEDLCISIRTVERHVANIFNKLDVSSRVKVRQLLRSRTSL
ncbi:LuxR C-terminal-related transcriptional regulator [Nesterenkonia ebinurensis]|uniref:LuxR C-terminal-related transcriptional regulator n=1 Tax=Nesterenkonia ebinurensis TaxID=2608252 RepID=UPI00295EB2E9|nr:LuxR C-terminal-related transcriptional regulator [Nesterenkonia ebinurensis]